MQERPLRLQVLTTLCSLMETDGFVCVKIVKLKLVSNILRHFVADQDLPEDDRILPLV